MRMVSIKGENAVIVKDLWEEVKNTNKMKEYMEFWKYIEATYPETKNQTLRYYPSMMMIGIYE